MLDSSLIGLLVAGLLVVLNGFFVAAEFALVKIRAGQIEALVERGRPSARTVRWLLDRLDAALSACQLGITMASLGLGWVAEPAIAHLIEAPLGRLGLGSPTLIHTVAFAIAFTIITVLHIVVGEQVPKIYAIRRADVAVLWVALPLKIFYYLSYPLMTALNKSTAFLLRLLGLSGGHHDEPHSEDELRALLQLAHSQGELSRAEHALLNAIFDFDDLVSRRVMVPRADVVFLDIGEPLEATLKVIQETQHSRYPVCEDSLDDVLGILHIKDLVGIAPSTPDFDIRPFLRPALRVPESMLISRLLRVFQHKRQLMALVVDEFGNTIGMVTLENVLEQIVGPVEDEFDEESPEIVEEERGRFLVHGGTALATVRRRFALELEATGVDTFSGFLMATSGRILEAGDRFTLEGAKMEVLEAQDGRATLVQVELEPEAEEEESASPAADAAEIDPT